MSSKQPSDGMLKQVKNKYTTEAKDTMVGKAQMTRRGKKKNKNKYHIIK